MSIKQLLALIAPPKTPLDNEGNWHAAEMIVGTEFPPDFRKLITIYGSGAFFRGYLTIYNPLTLGGLARIKKAENFHRTYRAGLYPLPLPVHPDRPGLLAWGGDDNGNDYCWLTKGKPKKWPVVILAHGSESHPVQLRTQITGFLVGYATDRFEALVRPEEPFTAEERVFTPGRSQAEVAKELLKSRRGK
jgi:hypothetical protein